MNDTFNRRDKSHLNLISKLNNSVADLNFYAHRFLKKYGFNSKPQTGISDVLIYWAGPFPKTIKLPAELNVHLQSIVTQYNKVLEATPETADQIFRDTWVFVHDFDHLFHT